MLRFHRLLCVIAIMACCRLVQAQSAETDPSQDVETVIGESETEPQQAFSIVDRPIYRAIQNVKKELNDKFGINFAVEDTLIYQHTSGGVDPDNAMVNTVGLFISWKLYRSEDGKDFAGFGFQAEQRGDPLDGHFTDLRDSLGTLWSPNDSTSNDYFKINQLWWGQKIADGKLGICRSARSIQAQSSMAIALRARAILSISVSPSPPTRVARSPTMDLVCNFAPSRRTGCICISSCPTATPTAPIRHSKPSTAIGCTPGKSDLKPKFDGLGQGIYRLMVYERDLENQNEFGWALSCDQNITDNWGVYLRYGDNDGGINQIKRILSLGVSSLAPFGRKNDQCGVGVSYTHPTSDDLRDEYSADVFYRFQVTEGFELSADTQLIADPSASDKEAVAVFGLRARLLY